MTELKLYGPDGNVRLFHAMKGLKKVAETDCDSDSLSFLQDQLQLAMI